MAPDWSTPGRTSPGSTGEVAPSVLPIRGREDLGAATNKLVKSTKILPIIVLRKIVKTLNKITQADPGWIQCYNSQVKDIISGTEEGVIEDNGIKLPNFSSQVLLKILLVLLSLFLKTSSGLGFGTLIKSREIRVF